MSTGAEFAGHRPHGQDARIDETAVRILFVEHRTEIADAIRTNLGDATRGSFEVVRQRNLVDAAARIQGDQFDLLLIDPALPDVERAAAIELASDLSHRLPVVVLTGTEEIAEAGPSDGTRLALRAGLEQADIAGKLLSTIRRARRLGTGALTPIFCRIEGSC